MKTSALLAPIGGAVVVGLTVAMLFTSGWDRPPIETAQVGFRGTGMELVANPRAEPARIAANQAPAPPWDLDTGGRRASEVYENVQVLGDLGEDQFTRLMTAITEWISPEEGCNYCHNPENLASDEVYTKVVARKMLEMTRNVNVNWQNHVGQTGVTCYTCHRGNAVPTYVWFEEQPAPQAGGFAAKRMGQNLAGEAVGLTSLPSDPFTTLIRGDDAQIRVIGGTALPTGHVAPIQDTEKTYGLMVHMSESLGVNCTFCHNTRSFAEWDTSPVQRVSAFHGIRMVRDINANYIESITDVFPDNRLGPKGDVAKVFCTTCHQGVNKPLYGAQMAKDYPSLLAQ